MKALAAGLALTLAACAVAANGETSGPDGLMVWKDLLERPRPQPTDDDRLWRRPTAGRRPVAARRRRPAPRRSDGPWRLLADRHRRPDIDELDRRGSARAAASRCGTSIIAASTGPAAAIPAPSSTPPRPPTRCASMPRDYNLDLSRVVATGHSAGGHLALWLAARPATVRRNRGVRITLRLPGANAATIERRMVAPLKTAIRARLGDREIVSNVAERRGDARHPLPGIHPGGRSGLHRSARRWRPQATGK